MRTRVGETFEREVNLDRESIAAFADLVGDTNPVHHDQDHARRTRFGAVIACGAHTTALLMGLSAKHFARSGAMLGLGFRFRFKRPVLAGESITLWWQVVALRRSEALGGEVALLAGRARKADGRDAVKAVGKVLLCPEL